MFPLAARSAPHDSGFATIDEFRAELAAIEQQVDGAQRSAQLDAVWQRLVAARQTPLAVGEAFALLYRGDAKSVAFAGDFNNWQPAAGAATQFAGTDLWYYLGTLPADARVDYKIVVDGNRWQLDPNNPLVIHSGMGPNSELRMPGYRFPEETVRQADIPHGVLGDNVRLASRHLGYDVHYRVYTPANYKRANDTPAADGPAQHDRLPVVYVTDGHEYAADELGGMLNVLDNLIAAGRLRPLVTVFIDPRDPEQPAHNRRMDEYNLNPRFARFLVDELVPAIDGAYPTSRLAADRVLLGTSLGGLCTAYVGAAEGATFGKLGIQSPAFQFNPAIYDLFDEPPATPLRIYMTAGTLHDGEGGRTMYAKLREGGYDCCFREVHQGHSWGNWRGELAALLEWLVGPPATPARGDRVPQAP